MTTRRGTLALGVLGGAAAVLIARRARARRALVRRASTSPTRARRSRRSRAAGSTAPRSGSRSRRSTGAACELHTTREELVLSFVPNAGTERIRWDQATIDARAQGGPRPGRRRTPPATVSPGRRWPSRCASSSRPRSRGSSEPPTAPDFRLLASGLGESQDTERPLETEKNLRSLHPAVSRPGRCASQIEFTAFSAEEAAEWLARHGADASRHAATLASLFAGEAGFEQVESRKLGFVK